MTDSPSSPGTSEIWQMVAQGIQDRLAEGDGVWATCTGCHESEDGYDNGHYPHSEIFGCKLGGGCGECGGIGAIWDTTDYGALADDIIAADARAVAQRSVNRGGDVVWQMVPLPATSEMNAAGERIDAEMRAQGFAGADPEAVYYAMLDAAPAQPPRTPLDLSAGELNTLATDAFREAAQAARAAIQSATNAPPKINYFRPADAQPPLDEDQEYAETMRSVAQQLRAAQAVQQPDGWQWRQSLGSDWSEWFCLNIPIEQFREEEKHGFEDGIYEARPFYASMPSPVAGEASLQKMQTSPGEEIGQHIAAVTSQAREGAT